MKRLSSRANPLYKRLQRLAAGQAERAEPPGAAGQVVLLEGIHLCQAWLEHQGAPEMALFDEDKLESNPEVHALAQAVTSSAIQAVVLGAALAKGLSQVPHGQGVFFLVRAPMPVMPQIIDGNSLWLDRVQDPGNVGTLLRTAAAAGIRAAYLSSTCASAWSPKVLRSAQGAHFVMRIYENVNLVQAASRLHVPLLVTALEGAEPLYATPLPRQAAWVAGNEGGGVSPELLALAHRRVFIPQMPGVESLNVAAAMAVCLFEQVRQHGLPAPGHA